MVMQTTKNKLKSTNLVNPLKKDSVVEKYKENVPDYLKDVKSTGLENFGTNDFIMPRLGIIASKTKLFVDNPTMFKVGDYYHSIAKQNLGEELKAVICLAKKSVVLRAPYGSGRGILARSNDCIHWDKPNEKFEVILDKVGKVEWYTKKSVPASGLLEFGSSFPGNPKSQPAATLTYEYVVFLIDHPELSPVAFFMQKKATQVAKALNTALRLTAKPITAIRIILSNQLVPFGSDGYYIPQFALDGYVSHDIYKRCENIAEGCKDVDIVTAEDIEDDHKPIGEELDDSIPFDN